MGPCRSDLRPPGGRLPAHPSPAALTCPAEVARRRQGVPLQGLGHLLPRSVRDSEPLAASGGGGLRGLWVVIVLDMMVGWNLHSVLRLK